MLIFPKRCCPWPSSKPALNDKHAPFYQRAFFKEYKILVQGTIWSQSGVFGEMMEVQVSLNALGSVAQPSAPTAKKHKEFTDVEIMQSFWPTAMVYAWYNFVHLNWLYTWSWTWPTHHQAWQNSPLHYGMWQAQGIGPVMKCQSKTKIKKKS